MAAARWTYGAMAMQEGEKSTGKRTLSNMLVAAPQKEKLLRRSHRGKVSSSCNDAGSSQNGSEKTAPRLWRLCQWLGCKDERRRPWSFESTRIGKAGFFEPGGDFFEGVGVSG